MRRSLRLQQIINSYLHSTVIERFNFATVRIGDAPSFQGQTCNLRDTMRKTQLDNKMRKAGILFG